MRWQFHGLTIEGRTNDARFTAAWQTSFASRPASSAPADIVSQIDLAPDVPAPPPGAPDFSQGDLLRYYVAGDEITAHFPRFGQLRLELTAGVTRGVCTPAVLDTYGAFEDLVAISLSPHLRRRGLFLIHAFAASLAGRALLLVGGIGAGKTTTGLALLDQGWRLLSNDSPVLDEAGRALSYPGVLAAFPETFARFPATRAWAAGQPLPAGRGKLTAPAEAIWPGVWQEQAPVAAICFPEIEARPAHRAERLSPPETLRQLLPHAVEQWDRPLIPAHLRLLRRLVERAPGYRLRLGPDVAAIPPLLAQLLNEANNG